MPFPAIIDLDDIAIGKGGFEIQGVYDYAGRSVSDAGDINGDGIDDIVIGAPVNSEYGGNAAYVVFGSMNGFDSSITRVDLSAGRGGFLIHGEQDHQLAGYSVSR